jgi:hypothetical protein
MAKSGQGFFNRFQHGKEQRLANPKRVHEGRLKPAAMTSRQYSSCSDSRGTAACVPPLLVPLASVRRDPSARWIQTTRAMPGDVQERRQPRQHCEAPRLTWKVFFNDMICNGFSCTDPCTFFPVPVIVSPIASLVPQFCCWLSLCTWPICMAVSVPRSMPVMHCCCIVAVMIMLTELSRSVLVCNARGLVILLWSGYRIRTDTRLRMACMLDAVCGSAIPGLRGAHDLRS